MFSLQHNQKRRGQNRFCPEEGRRGEEAGDGKMYVHVSKCKNNKIKGQKEKIRLYLKNLLHKKC
jgi:hypothetical protein